MASGLSSEVHPQGSAVIYIVLLVLSNTVDKVVQARSRHQKWPGEGWVGEGSLSRPLLLSPGWLCRGTLTFEQWCKLHSNMTAGQPLIASKLGTS